MSHDSSDDADDDDAADDMEELTPWDHSCGPPPAGGNDAALPRGPPVPMPVSGPPPTAARGSRDTPPDAASGSRDAATASWEYDHSSGPQPVVVLEADGTRRVARVAGPLTRSGRFRDSSDSSGSSSNDDDEDDERDIRSPDGAADATDSGTWSETSLILEGPSLRDSKDRLCALYRQEVQDKAADEGCGLTSRSLAAQVGALHRRTATATWTTVQALARSRLTGARAREWAAYEHEATHQRRPRRDRNRSRSRS